MKDGDEIGRECPECSKPLIFYMGFQDCFNHKTGHYTINRPMVVCSDDDCKFEGEDYEGEDEARIFYR